MYDRLEVLAGEARCIETSHPNEPFGSPYVSAEETGSYVLPRATGVAHLNRWTGNRTVRTEHATVSLFRTQHRMTVQAFEKVNACIDGHSFHGYIAALGASQLTARLHLHHRVSLREVRNPTRLDRYVTT